MTEQTHISNAEELLVRPVVQDEQLVHPGHTKERCAAINLKRVNSESSPNDSMTHVASSMMHIAKIRLKRVSVRKWVKYL